MVDYEKLDPVKQAALEMFAPTLEYPKRLGIAIPFVGETAGAFDTSDIRGDDFLLTFNVEGLGTKNLIADAMWKDEKDPTLYEGLGQDNAAMSVNDLAGIGADAFMYGDIISSGDDAWFEDEGRTKAVLRGYRTAADQALFAIPIGETPTLRGIVAPTTLEMAGASVGIIRPQSRVMGNGEKLRESDRIFGLGSSGLHANGISKVRSIASYLSDGYFTPLPDGTPMGRAALTPTTLYTRVLMDMFDAGVDIHYVQPITGHGWRKIMRAHQPFTYQIDEVPEPSPLFQQLIAWGDEYAFDVSPQENYQVWNMGLGFVVFAPVEYEDAMRGISDRHSIPFYTLGTVKRGEKQVILDPLGVVYTD